MGTMLERKALQYHQGGKIEVALKKKVSNKRQLTLAYTPGVALVADLLHKNPKRAYDYTIKSNSVAIVSDGSRVLGLGNIGAKAAIPVMEGKAMLFKKFGNIDAFPLCIETQNADDIIRTVKNISPIFGGINLEDIEAPKCFEIEEKLTTTLDIPVFHDDQHGTAAATLAALINASKVIGKKLEDMKIIINGAGAAGLSIARLLGCIDLNQRICTSAAEIIVCDSKGALYSGREHMNTYKSHTARMTNPKKERGDLNNVITDADAFIGVSTAHVLKKEHIERMAKNPIVFALANPIPEINPDDALTFGAAVVGTGRSNYKNQINNLLAFPGIFRGALDRRAPKITKEMILCAAYTIATYVKKPTKNKIVPNPLDKKLHLTVAKAVRNLKL